MQLKQNSFYVSLAFFAGLLILPATWPETDLKSSSDFPFWLFGSALPSTPHLHKAWVVPLLLLMVAVVIQWKTTKSVRIKLHWFDGLVAFWCVWPLLRLPFTSSEQTTAWIDSLHLGGVWGAAWLLGRTFTSDQALRAFLNIAMVIVPFAMLEAYLGPFLHSWLYGHHPFVADGATRYFGFRPLLFFENGNQYGLFICIAAFAALAHSIKTGKFLVPGILAIAAFVSQSIGAIVLACIGLLLLRHRAPPTRLLVILATLVVAIGTIYFSAKAPVERIARNTEFGQKAINAFRSIDRGSLPWRISQDQRALAKVQHPIVGEGRWNWFEEANTRPWGLYQLVYGQYGLVGLLAFCAAFVAIPAFAYLRTKQDSLQRSPSQQILAIATLLAALDGFLNSFVFLAWPLFAGILATWLIEKRPTRI